MFKQGNDHVLAGCLRETMEVAGGRKNEQS